MSDLFEVIDHSQREDNEDIESKQAAFSRHQVPKDQARLNERPKPLRKFSGTREQCESFVTQALQERAGRKLEIFAITAPEKEQPEPKIKPVVVQRSEPETVDIASVVVDLDIYPRKEWSQATIRRYADAMDAGAEFPPIVLERGTRRLLDGMHRLKAAESLELATIVAERHQVPDDASPLLYAASLSSAHGDRITNAEMREIARHEAIARGLDHGVGEAVARYLSAKPRTVRSWIADLYEQQKRAETEQMWERKEQGATEREIAEEFGLDQANVNRRLMRNGKLAESHNPSSDGVPKAPVVSDEVWAALRDQSPSVTKSDEDDDESLWDELSIFDLGQQIRDGIGTLFREFEQNADKEDVFRTVVASIREDLDRFKFSESSRRRFGG